MIALYRGVSGISRVIRWFHRSEFSHAAEVDEEDGSVCEAWHVGGVRRLGSVHEGHTPGTVVELYWAPLTKQQCLLLRQWQDERIGCGYDWRGVGKFLTRREGDDRRRWFCSELVAAGREAVGAPLFWARPWELWPGALAWSLAVEHVGTVRVGERSAVWMTGWSRARELVGRVAEGVWG